jgi:CheY-like chemotaxis protein
LVTVAPSAWSRLCTTGIISDADYCFKSIEMQLIPHNNHCKVEGNDGVYSFLGGADIVTAAQVMLVDDFKPWRLKLRSILEAIPGISVVSEAGNGFEAIEMASRLLPDIVLLDIGMPLLNGLEAAPIIRRASPRSKLIFLTQEHDSDFRTAAVAVGADGYLLKSRVSDELGPAMNAALLSLYSCHAIEFDRTASFDRGVNVVTGSPLADCITLMKR